MSLTVFVDSDVVISSLLSSSGAAATLFTQAECQWHVSTFSLRELVIVCRELGIAKERFKGKCTVTPLANLPKIQKTFGMFVTDIHDAHIIAGAKAVKAQFLVTYNLRHFRRDAIREQLGIIVIPPAHLLQHLRGRN